MKKKFNQAITELIELIGLPEVEDKARISVDLLTGVAMQLAKKRREVIDAIMKEKNKEVEDFLKDQKDKEPDHTIEAEHERLRLEESLFLEAEEVDEDLSEDKYEDFKSDLYDAVANVCFDYKWDNLSKEDIENGLDWFYTHFFDSDDADYLDESCKSEKVNLKEVKDFSYEDYGWDEESIKDLINELIEEGIDPWESDSHEEINDYIESDFLPEDVTGIKRCIKKYIKEHQRTNTVWSTIYNEIVQKSKGLTFVDKDNRMDGHLYNDISTDVDGFVVKGHEKLLPFDLKVADFYKLRTIGPKDLDNDYYDYELKLVIPEKILMMDVREYLDSVK